MKNLFYSILIYIIAICPQCSSNSVSGDDHSSDEVSEASASGTAVLQDSSDYTILMLWKQPFAFTLRTGGRILVDSKDLSIITAKSSGLVKLKDDYLFPG